MDAHVSTTKTQKYIKLSKPRQAERIVFLYIDVMIDITCWQVRTARTLYFQYCCYLRYLSRCNFRWSVALLVALKSCHAHIFAFTETNTGNTSKYHTRNKQQGNEYEYNVEKTIDDTKTIWEFEELLQYLRRRRTFPRSIIIALFVFVYWLASLILAKHYYYCCCTVCYREPLPSMVQSTHNGPSPSQ